MRVILIEDSLENRETLRMMLAERDKPTEIVGEAGTLSEARKLLEREDVDLAFLDIQFREGTIFEVLEELLVERKKLPMIVFVTAHGSFEFAIKAIHFACLDFITKPIDRDELENVLKQAEQKQMIHQQQQLSFMLELLRGDMHSPKSLSIVLPKGVLEFVELCDILYFTADENTCRVAMVDKRTLHSTRSLGYYFDLLMGNREFIQISKSCIVNLQHLKRYNHRDKSLLLRSGETLVASHRYSKTVRKHLTENESAGVELNENFNLLRTLFGAGSRKNK